MSQSPPSAPPAVAPPRTWGQRLFLGFLAAVGGLYGVIVIYHATTIHQPQAVPFAEDMGFMEECRQICLKYGLLTTGHVENDARAYLHKAGKKDLSEGLVAILGDRSLTPEATMPHSLLNQPAPEFELKNVDGQLQSLSAIRGGGPAIVVFYYGYGCSHCVAQLFGLDDDRRHFEELGVPIIAISSDPPEHTAEKYKEYKPFHFPVLSDPDNKVAQAYGTFTAASADKAEVQLHGTFLVSPEGQILWANTGHQPFIDNKTLLLRMAEITGAWSPPAATTAQSTIGGQRPSKE